MYLKMCFAHPVLAISRVKVNEHDASPVDGLKLFPICQANPSALTLSCLIPKCSFGFDGKNDRKPMVDYG